MPAAELGQVFTPAAVADVALALALETAPRRPRLLDPSCGDGVFLARAVAAGVPAAGLAGYDVDTVAAAAAARVPGARVVRGDFLAVAPPAPGAEYDAVATNPPYVRQELLRDKPRLAARLAADWPELADAAALAGRADLAVAFVARALRFVRPGGRVALVLSAAMLEAGYGDALRAFLRGRAHLVAVVASPRERWFPDAAVHGVILVLERASAGGAAAPAAVFARLRLPVGAAAPRITAVADLAAVADVRTLPAAAVWEQAWAPLLRAPTAWFDAARAAGDALVRLDAVAEVRRGLTTGANEFFYLSRAEAARRRVEPRFLVPVLRSPRQTPAIRVAPDALPVLAFVCDLDARALAAHRGAHAYVRAHRQLAARPTLAARDRWWSLPARPARVFLTKAYDVRFVQPFATAPLVADQRVYALAPRRGVDAELLAAVLNGSLTALALESLGRASLGEGALEWSVADAASLPVLDPRHVLPAARAAFRALATRTIGPAAAEASAADRVALDAALAGARQVDLAAVRTALAETVAERKQRAG